MKKNILSHVICTVLLLAIAVFVNTEVYAQDETADNLQLLHKADTAQSADSQATTSAPGDITQDPMQLYNAKQYEMAARVYEHLLARQGVYAGYYYNLGNCYYKMNKLGLAILNYERALRITPMDRDVKNNLRMAQLKTIDRVADNQTFFNRIWHRITCSMSLSVINALAIVFFITVLFFVNAFFFVRQGKYKRLHFYLALSALSLCVLFNAMAWHAKNYYRSGTREAVVIHSEVAVRSTPSAGGVLLFNVHEGTKVHIMGDMLSGWYPISLGADKEGWLPQETVETIGIPNLR